jgi:hypothetical protein
LSATAFLEDLQKKGIRLRPAPDGQALVVTPKSRLTPEVREAILARKPELLALLTRVQVFKDQMSAWAAAGRWAVPMLVMPGAPDPRWGFCVSCGAMLTTAEGWRCATCLSALDAAFDMSGSERG